MLQTIQTFQTRIYFSAFSTALILFSAALPSAAFAQSTESRATESQATENRATESQPSQTPNAQPAPNQSRGVRWLKPPRPVASDFPKQAVLARVSGWGVVTCEVAPDGKPINCRVDSEHPADMGFGQAALQIIQRGRLAPRVPAATNSEEPLATFTVRIPFNSD